KPLMVQAYDPILDETVQVSVPQETLAGWVNVSQQGSDFTLGLDGQRLAAYLEAWKPDIGPDRSLEPFIPPADLAERWQNGQPVTATVRHNATTYTVEAGETLTSIAFKVGMPYWKIQQANPDIDPDQLRAGQELTIPSKNEMLPLPVVPNKRIVISISQQRMWVYENGSQIREHVISTGIDRSPTIPGIYQVRTHDPNAYASVWDLYMPNFMGIYEGWPGFMNGIHGLPTLSSGRRLWAGNLGRPVSYGCIILGLQEAEDLYNWAEEGVIVEIQP
ncbi:MAG: LysM peptidoglycan-binding domain-containing protein, partial [Chloroflexi bacterium]